MPWFVKPFEGKPQHGEPIIRFMRSVFECDLDGKPYRLTCEGKKATITDIFSDKVVWSGEIPGGAYGIESALFIGQTLGILCK
jgi:hypothetical protein